MSGTWRKAQGAKEIGIYSAEAKAKVTIDLVKDKPGFRDWPGGFRIFEKNWTGPTGRMDSLTLMTIRTGPGREGNNKHRRMG